VVAAVAAEHPATYAAVVTAYEHRKGRVTLITGLALAVVYPVVFSGLLVAREAGHELAE
jgi:hypothetical protein